MNDYCVAEVSASALKHNIALIRRELKPAAKVGDEVEVISRETETPNSADNLALLAGTIVPEIVSGLGSRVRRVATS